MHKYMMNKLFSGMKDVPFQINYWDASSALYGEGQPRFKISFREKVSLAKWMKSPTLSFGEAYMEGAVDIDGKIEDIIDMAARNSERIWKKRLSILPKTGSIRKQKQNVQHHYDV